MTSPSHEDALKSLTRNEAYVFYWKCYGWNYVQIAQKLDYGEDWVTLQMSRVYKKLDFNKEMHSSERKRILKSTYCPLFNDLIEGQYSNIDKWIPVPIPVEVGALANKEETKEDPTPDPEMLALVLYDAKPGDDDDSDDDSEKPDPPVIHVPARLPAPRPTLAERFRRIFIFAIIVLTVICAVGYFAFRMGQVLSPGNNLVPLVITATSQAPTESPQPTSSPEPSATLSPTDTATVLPPTDTATPTKTPSPLDLGVGDFFEDNRVTLKLTEYEFNPIIRGASAVRWAIWFVFEFSSHTNDQILLRYISDDFTLVDNTGIEYECQFVNNLSITTSFSGELNFGDTHRVTVACGNSEKLGADTTSVTLTVQPFSSLPTTTWVIEVPR